MYESVLAYKLILVIRSELLARKSDPLFLLVESPIEMNCGKGESRVVDYMHP